MLQFILFLDEHLFFYFFHFQGESTDNFNWGVRRRPLSEGEGEGDPSQRNLEESLSEKTPMPSTRKVCVYLRLCGRQSLL